MNEIVCFLLFCAASVGLTSILVDGKLFQGMRNSFRAQAEKVRRKRERGKSAGWSFSEWVDNVLGCYQCCGFWSGILCGLLLMPLSFSLGSLAVLLGCGWAASLLAVLFVMVLDTSRSAIDYLRAATPQQPIPSDQEPHSDGDVVDGPDAWNEATESEATEVENEEQTGA
ncbi:MAG TPA: hypothetical protein DEB39_02980 [Planctomycetaceae bacterium]|nr:hypothetical protein [Planctomycetaceae bacterium]